MFKYFIFRSFFLLHKRGIDVSFLHSSRRLLNLASGLRHVSGRPRSFGGHEQFLGGFNSAGIRLTGNGDGPDGGVVTNRPLGSMSALSAHQCSLHCSSHCHDGNNDTDNDSDDIGFVTVALAVISTCKMCKDSKKL